MLLRYDGQTFPVVLHLEDEQTVNNILLSTNSALKENPQHKDKQIVENKKEKISEEDTVVLEKVPPKVQLNAQGIVTDFYVGIQKKIIYIFPFRYFGCFGE